MSGAKAIIDVLKAENGYREGYANGHWDNDEKYAAQVPGLEWANYQPWCAVFVSWGALKSGNAALFPRTASCSTALDWFKQRGRFSEYPAIGAQVFYGPNGSAHTGVVYAYDGTYIYTVEGNTNDNGSAEGNGVYLKKRARRDVNTFGYGMPEFPEGVTTADPSLKGRSGFHYEASASGPVLPAPVVAPPKPVPAPAPSKVKTVIVKSGMTLTSIAVAAGISLAALLTANPAIKNPNVIYPGETITVPAAPTSAKPLPVPSKSATPTETRKPVASPTACR
jgi:LysM repeat protein